MSSHVHLIVRAGEKELLENVLRDLKRYTSKCFHDLFLSEHTKNADTAVLSIMQASKD